MSKAPKNEPMEDPPGTKLPKVTPQASAVPVETTGVDVPASPEEMAKALDYPSINEPPGPRVPVPTMHTLDSLSPDTAAIGDDDVTMHVIGTGFTASAQIVFNGGPETTVFVSATELTTTVKPSTAQVAGAFPVTVAQNGFTVEPPLDFTFTEEPASRRKRRK